MERDAKSDRWGSLGSDIATECFATEFIMKKTIALLTAGSLMAISAPAFAQDGTSTFTGPRVEAILGYDISKAGSTIDDDTPDNDNDQSIDGFMYGIAVGYDYDLGGAVVGLEAELSDSTAKVEAENGDIENFGFGNVKAGRDIYLGARVGFKAAPDALVYVKGGYTNARYNIASTFDGEDFRQSLDTDGYRIGAGAEYAVSENSFVKLEYRYSNYSEGEIDFETDAVDDSDRFDIDTDRHQIVVGYGFRF